MLYAEVDLPGLVLSIECPSPWPVRYLSISSTTAVTLVLCEVKVEGYSLKGRSRSQLVEFKIRDRSLIVIIGRGRPRKREEVVVEGANKKVGPRGF